jgi:hypothetical protein
MSKEREQFQSQQPPQQQIPIPEVYSNAAIANISPYEFEITLGLASANYEGVRPVVNVRMSPQFAREFARILAENVRQYEKHFGEIKAAPALKEAGRS